MSTTCTRPESTGDDSPASLLAARGPMPDFRFRHQAGELMDDPDVSVDLLESALHELPRINRWLGGYAATIRTLERYYRTKRPRKLRILDVGCGIGDYAIRIIRWGLRRRIDLTVTGLDVNPSTIAMAHRNAARCLRPNELSRVQFVCGDALDLDDRHGSFDICASALFFHHLSDSDGAKVLKRMSRVASAGVLVNDIHRHVAAYYGIVLVTRALPFSRMVRNDGPISVLRAFDRPAVERLAERAGLRSWTVRWHWAFRWILTTLPQV